MTSSDTDISIYHCLCANLALATKTPLSAHPSRSQDGTWIVEDMIDQRLQPSEEAKIIRLADGFEKRYEMVCRRCRIVAAYHLDRSELEANASSGVHQEVLYVLPGTLQTTAELQKTQAGQ